jgi:cation diffusion facilitator CzcD-associated flavoprotein CzcO
MRSEKTKSSPRVVVIGAGMAGILSGIRLAEAGLDNYTIYEKADDVGGTWRENTYPGIGCDVPSHIYSYSFELNPDWSQLYSPGNEILGYFRGVAKKYGVHASIRFEEEIVRCEFSEGRWRIETSKGRKDEADFVIAATGVLHHPNIPNLPGLESFGGEWIHSARWRPDLAIEGKRVGVVGTGSSAVQIVGAATSSVEKMVLFQRTAQWIAPQLNPLYTDQEKEAFHTDRASFVAMREAMASDYFEQFSKGLLDSNSEAMQTLQALCRTNLEESVTDPELRERLRPDYQAACKRLVVSGAFYEAIQQPNAELVTEGIECIEPGGIRTADGSFHELDVLVLATGFRVDRFVRPIEVIGRGGVNLNESWRERPSAYLSISVPDMPNFFMLNGPNGPVGNFSLIEIAEKQFDYILQLIELRNSGRCNELSVTHEALEAFEVERTEAAQSTIWNSGCRSWYLDDRGVPASWPWTFDRFREEMSAPKLEAYDLRD